MKSSVRPSVVPPHISSTPIRLVSLPRSSHLEHFNPLTNLLHEHTQQYSNLRSLLSDLPLPEQYKMTKRKRRSHDGRDKRRHRISTDGSNKNNNKKGEQVAIFQEYTPELLAAHSFPSHGKNTVARCMKNAENTQSVKVGVTENNVDNKHEPEINTHECVSAGHTGNTCNHVDEESHGENTDQLGNNNSMDPASVFFELANSSYVAYRVPKTHLNDDVLSSNEKMVVIRQDNDCSIHTGGIVWETAYLLAEFLLAKFGHEQSKPHESNLHNEQPNDNSRHPLGKTLEIGAGCGMLGLILASSALSSKVVLTEASEVMENLAYNVKENVMESVCNEKGAKERKHALQNNDEIPVVKFVHGITTYLPSCPPERISVRQLRWDRLDEDTRATSSKKKRTKKDPPLESPTADAKSENSNNELEPHSFDTIVGTDVVFSPSLVQPLLETIQRMAHIPGHGKETKKKKKTKKSKKEKKKSKEKNIDDDIPHSSKHQNANLTRRETLIYLCLQIRCPDSHALLFSEAPKYGLEVIEITQELSANSEDGNISGRCAWGLDLECVLLKINVL